MVGGAQLDVRELPLTIRQRLRDAVQQDLHAARRATVASRSPRGRRCCRSRWVTTPTTTPPSTTAARPTRLRWLLNALEEQINGTENMLYMFSQAASDGTLTLTVTFALGSGLAGLALATPEPLLDLAMELESLSLEITRRLDRPMLRFSRGRACRHRRRHRARRRRNAGAGPSGSGGRPRRRDQA